MISLKGAILGPFFYKPFKNMPFPHVYLLDLLWEVLVGFLQRHLKSIGACGGESSFHPGPISETINRHCTIKIVVVRWRPLKTWLVHAKNGNQCASDTKIMSRCLQILHSYANMIIAMNPGVSGVYVTEGTTQGIVKMIYNNFRPDCLNFPHPLIIWQMLLSCTI